MLGLALGNCQAVFQGGCGIYVPLLDVYRLSFPEIHSLTSTLKTELSETKTSHSWAPMSDPSSGPGPGLWNPLPLGCSPVMCCPDTGWESAPESPFPQRPHLRPASQFP